MESEKEVPGMEKINEISENLKRLVSFFEMQKEKKEEDKYEKYQHVISEIAELSAELKETIDKVIKYGCFSVSGKHSWLFPKYDTEWGWIKNDPNRDIIFRDCINKLKMICYGIGSKKDLL